MFGVAVAASACILLSWASRGWLRVDDFNALGSRLELVEQRGLWTGLNAAHNDHWSAAFFALHLALVSVTGLESYLPMAALSVASACAVVAAVRCCLVRLEVNPWIAALWPPVLLWWGTAPLSVLWGFDAVFTLAAALLLLTALLLDRPERWARLTLAASLLAGAALQGAVVVGAVVVVAVGVVSATGRTERRGRMRVGALVVGPSIVATGAWMLWRDRRAVVFSRLPGEIDRYNTPPELVGGLRYAAALGRRVLSGFLPGPVAGPGAWCTAALVAVALASTLVRHRRDPGSSPFVVGLPMTALVLILTIGVTRAGSGQGADVSRYLHLATALLFPLAGLAVSDAVVCLAGRVERGRGRGCVGRGQGQARRAVALVPVAVLLVGLVVVGASRIEDESDLLARRGRETKAVLEAHLADPALGLVPSTTRVSFFTLDMTVAHLRRWGERGWLASRTGTDQVRSTAVLWVHVRAADGSDAADLPIGPSGGSSGCWTSQGGTRIVAVDLLPGRTGAVRWSDRPGRLWARVTIGEATTPWRALRSSDVVEVDGVAGVEVELRVTGRASTC